MSRSIVLALVLAACGGKKASKPPSEVIEVVAKKWAWEAEYANGVKASELHLPANTTVAVDLTSADVVHTFAIDELHVKHDAVPGKTERVLVETGAPGAFGLRCLAACGMPDGMQVRVMVDSPEAYAEWLTDSVIPELTPVDLGKRVYESKGCNACHSIDGTPKVGTSLAGIWGRPAKLTDGTTVTVDAAFVRLSLTDPQKAVREGFPPTMPSFADTLTDQEIEAVTAYIESLP